ncbi:hypothetical protein COU59_02850 [Candidatus Pacearchaeota archaeon CG10_big_fil_rev_8_21_14_0_10_34_12]|nr:MAG: hypothetical protein COU59_02850 [Candidatus Pacearchaeota archaeon CG10_big_fil_rev_8_21_14_0_10_34_12]
MVKKKHDYEFYAQIGLIVFLVGIIAYSLFGNSAPGGGTGFVSASEIIPTGIPAIYGEELGLQYDYVSEGNPQLANQAISFLGNFDRTLNLEGANLERYINILYNMHGGISCEYCCGARSIIFSNGDMACGCAHSYAMRGLTKYLVLNYPEMSDEEILEEIGKWKVLFFPGIMEGKAQVLESNGIDSTNYINLASNKYRGIEQGAVSGGMVGGC